MLLLKQEKTFSLRRNSVNNAKIVFATFIPLFPPVLQIIGIKDLPCGDESKTSAIQLPQGGLLLGN